MKNGKKIAVGLAAALALAIFAAGAVSMVGAQVAEDLDVSIDIVEIDFNEVMLGDTAEIARAFTLTNNGPLDAKVEASSAGLFNETKKIPAERLRINGVQLSESDTHIATVGVGSTEEFDAVLSLLADQEPGEYRGTVELTFTSDVADVDPDGPDVDPEVPDEPVVDPDGPVVDPDVPVVDPDGPDVPVVPPEE